MTKDLLSANYLLNIMIFVDSNKLDGRVLKIYN